jgi:hypothetical protein
MKEKIMKNQEKLTIEEMSKRARRKNKEKELWAWVNQIKAEGELKRLSKNPQLFNTIINVWQEIVKEMEEALQSNVEYFSNKRRYEMVLVDIKGKKGMFFNLFRKYIKYKLKKSINKPPKRLEEDSRRFLEKTIKEKKNTIAILEEYKKENINKFIKEKIRKSCKNNN